ncbi:hypothetical protein ACO0SA_000444 [Hanseniaspora valbyensis]
MSSQGMRRLQNTNGSENSKTNIKLPSLVTVLQMQANSAIYNTPTTTKTSTFNVLPFISPTMSDGGFQNASFTGKFHTSFEERPNVHFNKLNFMPPNAPLPLSPPNVSDEKFSTQQQSFTFKSADDTFYNKQNHNHLTSSPSNPKKSFDFYLKQNNITEQSLDKCDEKIQVSKVEGLGLTVLKNVKETTSTKKIIKTKKNNLKTKSKPSSGKFAFILHSKNSYSCNEEPFIDNEQLARQKRRRTDSKVVSVFEDFYNSKSKKPNKVEKIGMSKETGLTVSQVQVWFQNRRSRDAKSEKTKLNKTIV